MLPAARAQPPRPHGHCATLGFRLPASGGRAAQQTGLASSAQFPFPSPAPAAPVGGGSTLTHGEGVWKGPTIQWVRGSAGMG
jgi:hypothetical protein